MLAGLIFATHDADDRPGRLAATLPFGGVTLIEYQARLLVAAGASQIIVVVARLTPELLGAISRIGRRGIAVDPVRSAVEAAEKLHPLARVLMLADGLVASASTVALLGGEDGDALLVTPEGEAQAGFERLGGGLCWAGAARLDAQRIVEVARLPSDYDMQSTLIRVAAQARAIQVLLPADATRQGHGIEHRATGLATRGRIILSSIVSARRGWFDRFVLAPVARVALPLLIDRTVPAAAVGAVGTVLGLAGLVGIAGGWAAVGLMLALIGTMTLGLGATPADLRDEGGVARAQAIGVAVMPGLAALLTGFAASVASADGTARTIAVALVVLAALAERAIRPSARRPWWGSPPAYLLLLALSAIPGFATIGLALAAVYAVATLERAIDDLRQQP